MLWGAQLLGFPFLPAAPAVLGAAYLTSVLIIVPVRNPRGRISHFIAIKQEVAAVSPAAPATEVPAGADRSGTVAEPAPVVTEVAVARSRPAELVSAGGRPMSEGVLQ